MLLTFNENLIKLKFTIYNLKYICRYVKQLGRFGDVEIWILQVVKISCSATSQLYKVIIAVICKVKKKSI